MKRYRATKGKRGIIRFRGRSALKKSTIKRIRGLHPVKIELKVWHVRCRK
jgi:hypothetical protein